MPQIAFVPLNPKYVQYLWPCLIYTIITLIEDKVSFCFSSDEISVKKGEKVKLDVLLINADKVERNSSEGWTEVWTRGHGVNSDRLTVSDETLIINEFTVTDTGTYRVLDYEGETLITVSVTGERRSVDE
ncbi:hypothetical protein PO909_003914 [Leuciscus waleckii]